MARKIYLWCNTCKSVHKCECVHEAHKDTEVFKNWNAHCPNCNAKFIYTEVIKQKPPH